MTIDSQHLHIDLELAMAEFRVRTEHLYDVDPGVRREWEEARDNFTLALSDLLGLCQDAIGAAQDILLRDHAAHCPVCQR